MKKRMSFILAAVLTAVSLTGCGAGSKPAQTTTSTAAAKEEETTERRQKLPQKKPLYFVWLRLRLRLIQLPWEPSNLPV